MVKARGFDVATKYFFAAIESGLRQEFYFAIECFQVMTKFGQARHFLVTTELVMVERFYVATECGQREKFGVATWNFMLRHSWLGWGDFLSRLSIVMLRQS